MLIEIAVTEKLDAIEKRRYARAQSGRKSLATTDTTPTSRAVPAAVSRAVRERDGDQCTFEAADGRRCSERGGLEFHHEDPFGKGGVHAVGNVWPVCRAHNQHLAEQDYGAAHMNRFRSRAREARVGYGPGPRWPPFDELRVRGSVSLSRHRLGPSTGSGRAN